MNREILFRAKRIDNGEWVEGYFYKIWNDCYIMWGMSNTMPSMIEVEPDTICQYTGLTDKNGNEIFENDILQREKHTTIVVKWNETYASWCLKRKGWMFSHYFGETLEASDTEVVGNVFDNPELSEVWRESD